MKCEEIFAALEMLEKERGIPQDFMMGKIIQALTAAYKKDHELSLIHISAPTRRS